MDVLIIVSASIIVFAFGASIGSFVNVVVYRLPAGLSLLWPPSRCPQCLNRLKAYDNVPVLGWLWLKGRCRYCQSKISRRYPLVEGITGLLFLIIFWVFQFSIVTIGYWAFCSWLLALSLIDWDTMTLPHPLTKSGLLLGLVFQMGCGYLLEPSFVGVIKYLIIGIGGAVLGIWLFDSISILGSLAYGKAVMGGGDAKLAAMMGAWLGWQHLLIACFMACSLGVLVGGGAILLSRHKMGEKMPFGPFLALGAVITLFSGEAILFHYLRLFLPAA
ncbi:prepilin peptidase [Sphaerospermopsis aphanizomenoides BCCUSP55]|uniref:prepilin peptidase n=1 Tax=Sphaerospermopsis aphanizomenoides TaxID=459663 RepID=UPI000AE72AA2|nr:A24 family peptidase [Sphaerospermopsis aphanizomenoides]MBK1989242.1 prepilin peptidase [Sphaerospermopsis aphanizomenoides BCCUSP55]